MSTINTTPLYKLSVDQYDAMIESGIFTERDRLQLINGILVAKVTQGDDHCVADDLCRAELSAVLPPGWIIRSNKPVRPPPGSEPEPNESVVVEVSIRDYRAGPPGLDGLTPGFIAVLIVEFGRLQPGRGSEDGRCVRPKRYPRLLDQREPG